MFSKKTLAELKKAAARKVGHAFNRIKKDSRVRKKFILNYVAPAAMVFTLIVTITYWSNMTFGLTVKYDGETMVTIENEAVLEKANELLNSRRAIPAEDATAPLTYEITAVNAGDTDTSAIAVYNKIITASGDLADDAVGLFIDGDFIGAVISDEQIQLMLNENLSEIASSKDVISAEYYNDIQYSRGIYPKDSVCSVDELYSAALDSLNVVLTTQSSEEQEIPYTVVYNETNEQYEGYERRTQSGENGIQTVTTQYKYLDGELIDSEIVDTVITKEVVNEIITVGTKPIPDKGVGSGVLAWPTVNTRLESNFGYRWGKLHKGIDISFSGCYGTDIMAADGGVVTFAGYHTGGYGYCVVIDHGNGMQTRYAHCSAIYVSEGESVGKGQTIAAIGSSGNSSGAHLHFEVMINGSVTDPLGYL